MKTFSSLIKENCTTSDVNPGNGIGLGVTNHLTPVSNIVMNIRNLFSGLTGVVASEAEDGFSIKLNSSQFVSKEAVNRVLYQPIYQNQSIYSYISAQGLTQIKMVNLGQYIIVYIGPADIKAANTGEEPCKACLPCKEMLDLNISEAEMLRINEAEEEEEIEALTKKQLKEIISAKDKVRAAKQFGILVAQQISLPTEYYFAGVKSSDGDESIALRWKYIKRRPHGKSAEVTHTLINIFGTGKDAVWVGDFDKNAKFQLPEETKKLIESILELLGAEKTSDSCIYKIEGDDEKKEEKPTDEPDDNENDDSRGDDSDKSDDLLGSDEEKKKDKKKEDDLL